MKILFLIPSFYSLKGTLVKGLEELGHETTICDYYQLIPAWKNRFDITYSNKLPSKLLEIWKNKFIKDINNKYLQVYKNYFPDMVFIYNNQLIDPEVLLYFKKKSKVVIYLGDNPFYSFTSKYNLNILFLADHVFSPDTYWIEQLKTIGIKKIDHTIFGYDKELNYIKECSDAEKKEYGSDFVFIGRNYKNSWGYKRSLFISKFMNLNIKIYATDKGWKTWFGYFPEIKNKTVFPGKRMSYELVNTILNCCKIYPVDANPGLLNGLHIRIFDCIGSGILPLVEYRKDLELVFKDIEVPVINNYDEANEKALYYLTNELKRKDIIKKLREHIHQHFLPVHTAQKIINLIYG